MGLCLVEVGDLRAAGATFETLARLEPASWEAPSGLAVVALARGDVESLALTTQAWIDTCELLLG